VLQPCPQLLSPARVTENHTAKMLKRGISRIGETNSMQQGGQRSNNQSGATATAAVEAATATASGDGGSDNKPP